MLFRSVSQSRYFFIPSGASVQPNGLLGSNIKIKEILIQDDREYIIQCDDFVEFVHDASKLRLQNNMNLIVQPGQTIHFTHNTQRAEQVGGRLEGARYVTSTDSPELAPGIYTLYKNIYPDPTNYHTYNVYRQRYQAAPSANNTPFFWELASHIKTGLILTRVYRGQDTVGWTPWEPLSNRLLISSDPPIPEQIPDGTYTVCKDTDTNRITLYVRQGNDIVDIDSTIPLLGSAGYESHTHGPLLFDETLKYPVRGDYNQMLYSISKQVLELSQSNWETNDHRPLVIDQTGKVVKYADYNKALYSISKQIAQLSAGEYNSNNHLPMVYNTTDKVLRKGDYNQVLYSISKNIPTYNTAGDAIPVVFNPNTQVVAKGSANQIYAMIFENPVFLNDLVAKILANGTLAANFKTYFDTLYASISHNHNGVYSPVGHTHDDRYVRL